MKFVVRLVVSLVVLGILLFVLPWGDVQAGLRALDAGLWLAAAGIFVAGHNIGALKWRLMVNTGRCDLGALDAFRCYAAGLFANLCLPSIIGGDILRATLAGRATRSPEAVAWGSIADRLIDVFSLGVLIVFGALVTRSAVPAAAAWILTVALVTGTVGTAVGAVLTYRRPISWWPRRIRRHVARSFVALRRMRRSPGRAALAMGMSVTIQSSFVLANVLIGRGMGIDVPVGAWFLVWPLAKLVALIPVSLNGLGVRDATQGALLATMGIPVALGVVASLVWQSVLVIGGLLAGALWWALRTRADKPNGGLRAIVTHSS
jgi:glycosyltransferase 2 family protein